MSRKRRRSTRSASAPAGRITRNTGSVVAAVTRLTIKGDMVSCVINQPAPTFCIQVPVYEITAAIQSERNSGSRSGANAELAGLEARLAGGVLTAWFMPGELPQGSSSS